MKPKRFEVQHDCAQPLDSEFQFCREPPPDRDALSVPQRVESRASNAVFGIAARTCGWHQRARRAGLDQVIGISELRQAPPHAVRDDSNEAQILFSLGNYLPAPFRWI
jgi:hypothetical protein